MISADIIADSINPANGRITTYVLTYPRFIHSELMTHRMFSRNAASSRAIPVDKMIAAIVDQPAMPIYWGSSKPGMQSGEEIEDVPSAMAVWQIAMRDAMRHARSLLQLGAHKSITNRLLEPFAHMTTLLTATEFQNFFSLRCHPDAQPEFQCLAYRMLNEYVTQQPQNFHWGEWHIPFGDKIPVGTPVALQLKIATARAARISYTTHDAETNVEKDLAIHDRLVDMGHWSPFEHCALARLCSPGNFDGWLQYRKHFTQENREANLDLLQYKRPTKIGSEALR